MIRSLCLALLMLASGARAGEIVDMSGRKILVPDAINSVYAMTHAMPLVIALAPEKLAGIGSPRALSAQALKFLPPELARLPNLGGGPEVNLEKLKAMKLDIALGWTGSGEAYPARQIERIGLPVVNIDVDRLDQHPATFRFLGKLFHREARGEVLARALERDMAELQAAVAGVKEKPRVYYAESPDGLTTQCDASDRVEVISRAGGVDAVHCEGALAGNYPLGLERLLTLDPDVIVTRFPDTADAIKKDPRWARLKAVRAEKVFAAPNAPFNWFDRPPSFLRVLGARWLAGKLHPDLRLGDLRAKTRAFYALVFGVTPADADLDRLLAP
jgi:iron complex transport system substrate-binding protein